MSLEHRWSIRKPVYLNAVLFHRLSGLAQVTIEDISLEGAFIRGEAVNLSCQTVVDLSFALGNAGRQPIFQVQALVIHRARNGYGLMFKAFKPDIYRAIQGKLYAA